MTQMTDAVFDNDPMLGKGLVVGFVLFRAWLAMRLATGMSCQASWMQVFHPLIRRIAPRANVIGQVIQHATLFEQRDIGGGAGHTLRDVANVTLPVGTDLRLPRDLLLLARIVSLGFLFVLGALYLLLKAVNDDRHLGTILQNLR